MFDRFEPGARTPLEQHALGLGEGEDGVERVLHGVDEAGRALRLAVAGDGELDRAGVLVPVPVLRVRIRLQPIAADVEPDRRVECDLLVEEKMRKLGVERLGVLRGGEVAALDAPVADRLGHAGDQGADAGFALVGAVEAVEILRGDDVRRGHRPVGRNLNILLLEDGLALEVLNDGVAELPDDLVVGGDAGLGEVAIEGEAGGAGGKGRRGLEAVGLGTCLGLAVDLIWGLVGDSRHG